MMFTVLLKKIEKLFEGTKGETNDGWVDVEIFDGKKDSSTKEPFGLPLATPSLPMVLAGNELRAMGFEKIKIQLARYMDFCPDFNTDTLVLCENDVKMPLIFFAVLIGDCDLFKLMMDFGASLFWVEEKTDVYAYSLAVIKADKYAHNWDEMFELTVRSIRKDAEDEGKKIGNFFISEEMSVQSHSNLFKEER